MGVLSAGKMDRRVTIERATIVTDPAGGEVLTWAPIAERIPAEVLPISDGERWRAGEVAAHVTTRFRIRWGWNVTVEDRVSYEDRVYDLDGVKELGRREGQELTGAARGEAPAVG